MSSGRNQEQQDNPFAPPPEGAPDRPWEPRTPPPGQGGDQQGGWGPSNPGQGDRPQGGPPQGPPPSPWGRDRQNREGGGGPGNPRFDITDPAQRRARYALLSGMWAFFFVIFSIPQISLLLGALSVYWGISALRAKPRGTEGEGQQPSAADRATGGQAAGQASPAPAARPGAAPAPFPGMTGRAATKPQFTTAVSGLVAAGISLVMVIGVFSLQIAYHDYFDCVSNGLTTADRHVCNEQIPDWVRATVGVDS